MTGSSCRRELGYPSLFVYLRRKHKYSAGAAQNRKTAAELIQQVPEVGTRLESGDLCLSTVCAVAKVLTPANRDELLPRFFGLSRQEAEALVASIRPAAVIPTREVVTPMRPPAIRTLALAVEAPALVSADQCVSPGEMPRAATPSVSPGETAPAPATVVGTSSALALPPGLALPPAPPPRAAVEPLDAEVARLHLTVTR
ncbi:MAG TPA: HNH endonuclease, partial [Anaeromyxobacteraceae bacterium]|nr:HNH endonuclease [Anaeromyxobacteraceae bacterium]